ncbi:MAG TPA: class I SAM-dependent methyltransferase [Rhodocyclaceae bacterium]|nr:class I SAM-dependent methyltransferase [Rhodocyclaceae bacterium]
MTVFGKYSRYYDLLYRDKNYDGEAAFVAKLVERYKPGARSLMELGCGSGTHAACFAHMGYSVDGVDRSQDMLDAAEARCNKLPPEISQRLRFSQGDVRTVRLDKTVDCVLSLFHVISYMPDNADIHAAFTSARQHLQPGGIFIFDCWYGPAVLTDRPAVRIKRMQDDATEVTRLAEPVWHPNDCWVDVNYSVFIRDRATGAVDEVKETHRMRYLFRPELELFAAATGFRIEHAGEWMTERAPDASTWGVCFVLRAI